MAFFPQIFARTARRWTILLCLCISSLLAAFGYGQSSPAKSFDVISIKPNRSVSSGTSFGDRIPGKLTLRNLSLLFLVGYAYDVKAGQVQGLPAWADSEKYDVDAKMDAARDRDRMNPLHRID